MGKINEEVLKVLSLIEKGVINVEEGKDLIKVISDAQKQGPIDFNDEKNKLKDNISKFTESCNDMFTQVKDTVDPKVKKTLNTVAENLDKFAEKLYCDEASTSKTPEEDLDELEIYEEDIEDLEKLDGVEEEDK